MRVLVGVDQVGTVEPEAAQWVEGLFEKGLPMEWLHVVALPNTGLWSLDPIIAAEMSERMAEELAGHTESALKRSAPKGTTVRVRIGNPSVELLGRADDLGVDLVAVRASNKVAVEALWLGSVARALVEGAHQSVLLTRGSAPQHPLRVVVATDHSAYSAAALEKLVALAPKGIGRLTVVYALPEPGEGLAFAQKRTEEVAQQLGEALGLAPEQVGTHVALGAPFPAIEATLADTDADLLVLGAKGHGFWERLTLGSVSHRAANHGSRSTLILRA